MIAKILNLSFFFIFSSHRMWQTTHTHITTVPFSPWPMDPGTEAKPVERNSIWRYRKPAQSPRKRLNSWLRISWRKALWKRTTVALKSRGKRHQIRLNHRWKPFWRRIHQASISSVSSTRRIIRSDVWHGCWIRSTRRCPLKDMAKGPVLRLWSTRFRVILWWWVWVEESWVRFCNALSNGQFVHGKTFNKSEIF